MDALTFFLEFAQLQAQKGESLTVGELQEALKLSRQSVHRWLKKLTFRNLIVRPARGRYRLQDTYASASVGLCVLLPMDVYEYRSLLDMNRSKSA